MCSIDNLITKEDDEQLTFDKLQEEAEQADRSYFDDENHLDLEAWNDNEVPF